MGQQNKIIVFTDLDGTFLDHHSYDYTPAIPAVKRLQNIDAIIVPTTSKTMAEIKALNLPFNHADAIAENGMVTLRDGADYNVSKHYSEIIDFVNALPDALRCCIKGFHEMSVEDVVKHTGLTAPSAALAKDRLASEPFLWSGDDTGLNALHDRAAKAELHITQGGRFYHLMGRGGKDTAVTAMLQAYQQHFSDQTVISIALGDGPNDRTMLACVDYGVQIPSVTGHSFDVENPRGSIMQASTEGPNGWRAAIDAILDNLPFNA